MDDSVKEIANEVAVPHRHRPVFIVGMPRSGTKLLRDLLNNHAEVAVLPYESKVLPYYAARWDRYGRIREPARFDTFYQEFANMVVARNLRRESKMVGRDEWYSNISTWTAAGVFRAFYESYAKRLGKSIWGDKTPSYIRHMPLLVSLFPDARFVHIVRDVRDYCLSMGVARGKHPVRAGQRWADDIGRCRTYALAAVPDSYVEVKYETLVDRPAEALDSVLRFLGLEYSESVLELRHTVEALGDARGHTTIVRGNHGKWVGRMSSAVLHEVESVAGRVMIDLGYEKATQASSRRVPAYMMAWYRLRDGFSAVRYNVRQYRYRGALLRLYQYAQYGALRYERTLTRGSNAQEGE